MEEVWQNEILLAKAQALGCAYVLITLLSSEYEKVKDKEGFARGLMRGVMIVDALSAAQSGDIRKDITDFISENAKIFAENIIRAPLIEGDMVRPTEIN